MLAEALGVGSGAFRSRFQSKSKAGAFDVDRQAGHGRTLTAGGILVVPDLGWFPGNWRRFARRASGGAGSLRRTRLRRKFPVSREFAGNFSEPGLNKGNLFH